MGACFWWMQYHVCDFAGKCGHSMTPSFSRSACRGGWHSCVYQDLAFSLVHQYTVWGAYAGLAVRGWNADLPSSLEASKRCGAPRLDAQLKLLASNGDSVWGPFSNLLEYLGDLSFR